MNTKSDSARANGGIHDYVCEWICAKMLDRSASIMDLGCGTGALLRSLHSRGFTRLTGADILPPVLECENISYVTFDLDSGEAPVCGGSVDLLVAIEVVEHIENLGLFFREANRILKTNGLFLITTPNLHSVEARLRFLLNGRLKQFDDIGDPTHITPIYITPFTRLVRRHGFLIDSFWGFPIDGRSDTSRLGLRALSKIARLGGASQVVSGDNIFFALRKVSAPFGSAGRVVEITGHY